MADFSLGGLGAEGALAVCDALSKPVEEYENDASIEAMWAIKAYEHAEVYFNLICSVDNKALKLTPHDDLIYKTFKENFPDLKINILNEEELKSAEAKEKWRSFCNQFEGFIEDFNFATLIRLDSMLEYSPENSILVTRIQFYAIEIARNREGFNSGLKDKFHSKSKNGKSQEQEDS